MTKRRLTQAQQNRQKQIQAKRLERAKKHHPVQTPTPPQGLSCEQKGLLIAHYGTTLIIENQAGKIFRCGLRQNLEILVTGDKIIWQQIDEESGVVVALDERRSILTRPDKKTAKPIAANVDHIVIVLALEPLFHQTTLDRYLVLAETLSKTATIVINKCDIPTKKTHDVLWKCLPIYEDLGYSVIKVSSKTGEGLSRLQSAMKDHTCILVGQSGVGKSSLIAQLIPDATVRIQALSTLGLGKQTTTASRLYHMPSGGDIIDSPGIHQFDLHHFSKEAIERAFKEFAPYRGQCRFRNCKHVETPGCALQAAAIAGKIAFFRLQNYHTILADLS